MADERHCEITLYTRVCHKLCDVVLLIWMRKKSHAHTADVHDRRKGQKNGRKIARLIYLKTLVLFCPANNHVCLRKVVLAPLYQNAEKLSSPFKVEQSNGQYKLYVRKNFERECRNNQSMKKIETVSCVACLFDNRFEIVPFLWKLH